MVEGTSNTPDIKKKDNEKKLTLYEITSAKGLHFIDELVKIAPDASIRGGVTIHWKNNKFVLLIVFTQQKIKFYDSNPRGIKRIN